jgi:hypothetical protein
MGSLYHLPPFAGEFWDGVEHMDTYYTPLPHGECCTVDAPDVSVGGK